MEPSSATSPAARGRADGVGEEPWIDVERRPPLACVPRVVRAGAFRVGAPVGPGEQRYDLVFVDPPYATTREVGEHSALAELFQVLQDQVVAKGVVVVRTHRRVAVPDDYGPFHAVDRREWGTMSIVLLQAKADEQQTSGG